MERIKYILLLPIMLLCSCGSSNKYQVPMMDLSNQTFSLQAIDENAPIYNDIEISETENTLSTIDEIVLSENGEVAIRFNNKTVNVYDSSLNYIYSITINRSHCGVYLEWDKDVLHTYIKSTDYQYDIQMLHGNLVVYDIVDSNQSEEKWKSIYHSSGGSVQIIKYNDYTYYRTRLRSWRYNEETRENEIIVDVLYSAIETYYPIFIIILLMLLIIIITKIRDIIERKNSK